MYEEKKGSEERLREKGQSETCFPDEDDERGKQKPREIEATDV